MAGDAKALWTFSIDPFLGSAILLVGAGSPRPLGNSLGKIIFKFLSYISAFSYHNPFSPARRFFLHRDKKT